MATGPNENQPDDGVIDGPVTPILSLTRPFMRFLHVESSGGIVLVVCTIIALVLANSPWAASYAAFWDQSARIGINGWLLDYPLWYWVNDGLMTIFFFVIGLEIKREILMGELSDRRRMLLPVVAAIGGAVVPALIYASMQFGQPGQHGWAVPMATDIAFVVGCLALLGSRVPPGLKVFVLTLAIVDDILAVSIIAVFYTDHLAPAWIVAAAAGFALMVLLNRLGVRTVSIYVLVAAMIWLFTLKSGIHPTVAGVLFGLFTPASAWLGTTSLLEVIEGAGQTLRHGTRSDRNQLLRRLKNVSRETVSPLERLEVGLHPWVGFVIVPLFALANAGVPIELGAMTNSVAIAVAVGLILGKPVGIMLFAWITIRLDWAALPRNVSWPVILGAGCMSGIGFTMSLFVASLGLEGELLVAAKTGVLGGSLVSAGLGFALLLRHLPSAEATNRTAP